MIPILYDENETTFESGGIGYLADCTSCKVTEERNGIYECEFSYPCTGPLFNEIRERRIVFASHDDSKEGQPFDIYARSEPIDGIVTFNAHHISYRLSDSVVMPFHAITCTDAINRISLNLVSNNQFTFATNKYNSIGSFGFDVPMVCRDMLGGEEGSILTAFGGEYMFDKFNVYLYLQRGTDTNIEIRYGKNLVEYSHDVDTTESYNVVVPYWYQENDGLVTLPERYIAYTTGVDFFEAVPLDMTNDFEEKPTQNQLRNAATAKLNTSRAWIPSETYEINFAALWQTEEYKDFAPLQRVKLCDTVLVYFPQYGIQAIREKVVKTVYNTLLNRYEELTLGELPETFNGMIKREL